jgi:hypothetical protein
MNLNRSQRTKLFWMAFRTLYMAILVLLFVLCMDYTILKYGKDSQYTTAVALLGMLAIGVIGRWSFGLNREVISDPSIPSWLKTFTVLVPAWTVIVVGGGIGLMVAWN